MTTFFKRRTTLDGEMIVIGDQEWTPGQCVQILQYIAKTSDALNLQQVFDGMLLKYAMNPQAAAKIRPFVESLMGKTIHFFSLLISMQDGSLKEQVNFEDIDHALLEIDLESKFLFQNHQRIIYFLQTRLIRFFKGYLSVPELQQEIEIIFKSTDHDVRGFFHQLITLNAVQGLQPLSDVTQPVQFETNALNETIVHINALETGDGFHRDLAYLSEVQLGSFYDHSEQVHQLSELALPFLIDMVLPYSCLKDQRSTLQLLALLSEIYQRITQRLPSDTDKQIVLFALAQTQQGLRWQLDAKTSTPALLLYVAMLCLRGDTVYLEHPQQRLAMDQSLETSRQFLLNLQLSYKEIHASQQSFKTSIISSSQSHSIGNETHYLGFQKIPGLLSSHTLDDYLTQTLHEIKQLILRPFDAWHVILVGKNAEVSQDFRKYLFDTLHTEWLTHIAGAMPLTTLQQVDELITLFQTQKLSQIWRSTEKQMMEFCDEQTLTEAEKVRVDFLKKQSAWIQTYLCIRPHPQYASYLLDTTIEPESNDRVKALFHYDLNYLSQDKKSQLVQDYIKNQLLVLHRLCPLVRRDVSYAQQLRLFIDYLDEHVRSDRSARLIKATILCVELYQSIERLLPDFADMFTKLQHLSNISRQSAIKSMSQTLLTCLTWSTRPTDFYVRWLERQEVIRAAQRIHRAAQKVFDTPNDSTACKLLMQTLYEQQAILSKLGWYFPFGWFFGYTDTRDIVASAISGLDEMVSLGQIPRVLMQEAKEAALCAPLVKTFHQHLQQCHIEPQQAKEWQHVLSQIRKIQSAHSGFGMLSELRYYLREQRQKFMSTQRTYFYGPRQVDQVNGLLACLDTALKQAQSLSTDRLFLSKKEQQLQLLEQGAVSVAIQSRHLGRDYFDVWIQADQPVVDFQPTGDFELQQKYQFLKAQKNSNEPTTQRRQSRATSINSNPVVSDTQESVAPQTFFKRFYSNSSFFAFILDKKRQHSEAPAAVLTSPQNGL
ncbi:MAG: hypothetical protein CK424_07800 [Legionella sp.]|nr:MAG: hypothetical protein CK424_07800 [Legionella sp.]